MGRLKILGIVWPMGGPSESHIWALFAPATLQGEGAEAVKREKGVRGFSGEYQRPQTGGGKAARLSPRLRYS